LTNPLTVYIDYKSPYAYIAKDPTYALEEEFGIEIDWFPLTLNIASYLGKASKDSSGKLSENQRSPRQWAVVKYAYYDARRYAGLRGLTLKGTQKIWDSSLAAIGMLWIKRKNRPALRAYTDRVFDRFWKRDLDIENEGVIESLLAQTGVDTSGFQAFLRGEGRLEHDQLQADIFERGLIGVPTYLIDDEVYFGREHLPRVRWHLSGKKGPPPDIAYDTVLKPHQTYLSDPDGDQSR